MKRAIHSQQGAIAIFLSTILGLLLMVTTTYAVRLQVSELSQSSQIDRSEQAYYAAEAGIEDAIRRIQNNPQARSLEEIFPYGRGNGDMARLLDDSGNWLGAASFYNQNSNLREDDNRAQYGQLSWRHRSLYDQAAMAGSQVKDETIQFNTNELRRKMPAGICGREATEELQNNDSDPTNNIVDCAAPFGVFETFDGLKYCWEAQGGLDPSIEVTVISYAGDYGSIRTRKHMLPAIGGARSWDDGDSISRPDIGTQRCFEYRISDHNRRYIFRVKPVFEGSTANQRDHAGNDQDVYSVKYSAALIDPQPTFPLYIDDDSQWVDVIGESGEIRRRIVAQIHRSGRLMGIFDYVVYSGDETASLCKAGVQQLDAVYQPLTCTFVPGYEVGGDEDSSSVYLVNPADQLPVQNSTSIPITGDPEFTSYASARVYNNVNLTWSDYENAIISRINTIRGNQSPKLSTLAKDTDLGRYGRWHSCKLKNLYDNVNSDTTEWKDEYGNRLHSDTTKLRSKLREWTMVGENLAWGGGTANNMVNAWMDSDEHRAIILTSRFTRIGVGVRQSGGVKFVTLILSTPDTKTTLADANCGNQTPLND